jgi:hypothetical protein
MKPGKSYYRLDSLFGYTADISDGSYKYGKPFRVEPMTIQSKAEDGLKYKNTSDSVLFNSFLYDLEYLLFNYNFNLPIYDRTKSYKKNAIVLLFESTPIIISEDIGPDGLVNGKYIPLNEKRNFLNATPMQPYWSTASLKAYFENQKNGFFLPSDPQNLVNIKYIRENLSFMVKDYLNDSDVGSHARDPYHIHVYDQSFLTDPKDATDAFNFNFPKRLIFVNFSSGTELITKNIFGCFPPGSQIKICERYDDGIDNFMSRDFLSQKFPASLYFIDKTLEITQIDGNKYLIEYMSYKFSHSPTYIDIKNEKVIRVNLVQPEGSRFKRLNPSVTTSPNTVSPNSGGFFDVISINESGSREALLFLKDKSPHQTARLHLDNYTYFFVKTSPSTMGCVRMNNITSTLFVVSRNISIPSNMFFTNPEEVNFRILKNYGQLSVPTNQHLFVVSLHNNNEYRWSACYLIQNGDNFSFSAKIKGSDQDALFVCQTQIKIENYLYLFDTNFTLKAHTKLGTDTMADVSIPVLLGDITLTLNVKKFNLNSGKFELSVGKSSTVSIEGNIPSLKWLSSINLFMRDFPFSYKIYNYFLSKNQNNLYFSFLSKFTSFSFQTTLDNFSLNSIFVNATCYTDTNDARVKLNMYAGMCSLNSGFPKNHRDAGGALVRNVLDPNCPPPYQFQYPQTDSTMQNGYNAQFGMNLKPVREGAALWLPTTENPITVKNFLNVLATTATSNNQSKVSVDLPNNVLVGWYDD